MTKKPASVSHAPTQPTVRQTKILNAVNTLIQQSLLIVLDSATIECKCATCATARKLAPEVRILLDAGKVQKITKV